MNAKDLKSAKVKNHLSMSQILISHLAPQKKVIDIARLYEVSGEMNAIVQLNITSQEQTKNKRGRRSMEGLCVAPGQCEQNSNMHNDIHQATSNYYLNVLSRCHVSENKGYSCFAARNDWRLHRIRSSRYYMLGQVYNDITFRVAAMGCLDCCVAVSPIKAGSESSCSEAEAKETKTSSFHWQPESTVTFD